MANTASKSTQETILDAAETLFSQHGFNGTSLRQITEHAKANLASVNYHFGDKETLYLDVVRRRMRPINEARLAQLAHITELAGTSPPPLALVLDALIKPVLDAHQDPSKGGPAITQIIARTLHEPLPFVSELVTQEFQACFTRFSQAARRNVPQLPPEDFMWRMSFVIGAMHHTLAMIAQMEPLTRGICKNNDYQTALAHFISCSRSVLEAPMSELSFNQNPLG